MSKVKKQQTIVEEYESKLTKYTFNYGHLNKLTYIMYYSF